jgi:DHA1 family inner membrane transport protein
MHAKSRPVLVSALLVLMTFALGFAEFVLIGIVNPVAEGIGSDIVSVGNIVSWYALVCAFGTPALALATGRLPQRKVFLALLLFFNLGNLLTMFAGDYLFLLATRMLPAVSGGTLMALCMAFVPEVASKRATPLVLSLVLAGYSVSSVIGVPIGTMLAGSFGWRAAYLAVLVSGLVASAALVPFLPHVEGAGAAATLRAQVRLLGDRRVLLCVAMMVLVAGSTYVFYTYMTPILEDVMGFDDTSVSVILAVFGIACVASNLLSGWIASNFGVRGLPLTFTMHAALLAALGATIGMGLTGVVNMILVGLVMYAMNSTVQLLYQRVAREDCPSAVTFSASLHPMAFNAGIAAGSAVGGAVVSGLGMQATGPVGGAMALAGAIVAIVLCRADGALDAASPHSPTEAR